MRDLVNEISSATCPIDDYFIYDMTKEDLKQG